MTNTSLWIIFFALVAVALAVDLGLKSHRDRHNAISLAEAGRWTAFWIALAMVFAGVVYMSKGPQRAMEFLTGYLIEESLSIDNMFVFILIFKFFKIGPLRQPRVLKWGILGAVVMRFILIFTGVSLLQRFHWIMYLFGGILIVTAIKMVLDDEKEMELSENKILRLFQRFVPISASHQGNEFFVKEKGRWLSTPLFSALLVVEASDLVFALDSIPAVLAVSNDPFIVFTSNIFAILGLRALYFLVSGFLGLFRYLRFGLAGVLVFIGAKMLLSTIYPIPIVISLAVVAGLLGLSMLVSIFWKEVKDENMKE